MDDIVLLAPYRAGDLRIAANRKTTLVACERHQQGESTMQGVNRDVRVRRQRPRQGPLARQDLIGIGAVDYIHPVAAGREGIGKSPGINRVAAETVGWKERG